MDTQIAPVFLEGPLANRPVAAVAPLGMFYFATDTLDTYVRTLNPSTNAAEWELIGGGSSATGLSPKYWVNNQALPPVTPYAIIQAGVDAAVADGHDASNPATIGIFPGTYVEDVSLPEGISLFAVGGLTTVILQGRISLTGTSGINALNGLFVIGGIAVQEAATQAVTLSLDDCSITGNAQPALALGASGVSVLCVHSTISGGAGFNAIHCDTGSSDFSGVFRDCTITGGTAQAALQLVGGAGGSGWSFLRCSISTSGAAARLIWSSSTAGAVLASFTDCQLFSRDLNAATTVVIRDDAATGNYTFAGAGTTIFQFPANVVLATGGVTLVAEGAPHLGSYTIANLPTVIQADTNPAKAWAGDAHKAGGGAATGTYVYLDPLTRAWLTFSGDIPPV